MRSIIWSFYFFKNIKILAVSNNLYRIENPSALKDQNHWDNMNGTIERGYAGNPSFMIIINF